MRCLKGKSEKVNKSQEVKTIHIHIYIYIHTHICIYIHSYTHTRTYTPRKKNIWCGGKYNSKAGELYKDSCEKKTM